MECISTKELPTLFHGHLLLAWIHCLNQDENFCSFLVLYWPLPQDHQPFASICWCQPLPEPNPQDLPLPEHNIVLIFRTSTKTVRYPAREISLTFPSMFAEGNAPRGIFSPASSAFLRSLSFCSFSCSLATYNKFKSRFYIFVKF